MKSKPLFLIIALLISCNTPNENIEINNNFNNNSDLIKLNIGSSETGDIINITETLLFRFTITVQDKDLNYLRYTNSNLNDTISIVWEIDGNTFDGADEIGSIKSFDVGSYTITCKLTINGYNLEDEITLNVTKHEMISENNFQNIYFNSFSGGVKVDQNDDLYITSYYTEPNTDMPVLHFSQSNFTKYYSEKWNYYYKTFIDNNQKPWFSNYSKPFVANITNGEFVTKQVTSNDYGQDIHYLIDKIGDNSTLLVANHEGTIFEMDKTTLDYQEMEIQPLSVGHPSDMKYDSNGHLWITSDSRTKSFDGITWTDHDTIGDATSILIDGDKVLIGDFTKGLFVYENGEWTNFNKENSIIPNGYITSMKKDNNDLIHIGFGTGGIYTFENDTFTPLVQTNGYNYISEIDFKSNNKMVFSHSKGVSFE